MSSTDRATASRRAAGRGRVPPWALVPLVMLPVWGVLYARALTTTADTADTPLGVGAAVYASACASCHGANGDGAPGGAYAFTDGAALLTFPNIEDHLRFVDHGTDAYRVAGVDIYGDPNRPGGAHRTGARGSMPPFGARGGGTLSDIELVAVVCHERFTLAGIDTVGDEYERWCAPTAPVVAALTDADVALVNLHEGLDGINPIGDQPAAATTRPVNDP